MSSLRIAGYVRKRHSRIFRQSVGVSRELPVLGQPWYWTLPGIPGLRRDRFLLPCSINIEYGVFNRFTGIFRRSFSTVGLRSDECSVADDDDVLEEKRRVMSSENMDDVLAIKELTKVFSGNGREYNSQVFVSYVRPV